MVKCIRPREAAEIPCNSIGFELTRADFAARVEVNIEGQHGVPGTPEKWRGLAAVEIALRADVPVSLARTDATFVFQRPDCDAICAAAIVVLRRLGIDLPAGALERIALIAAADSFAAGARPWAPYPLPTRERPYPGGSVDSTESLAALGALCSPGPGQTEQPLAYRVLAAARWILRGLDPSPAHLRSWVYDPAIGPDPISRVAEILGCTGCDLEEGNPGDWLALRDLERARREAASTRESLVGAIERCPPRSDGRVAVVEVEEPGATGVGYALAPVVICRRSSTGQVGIGAWGAGWADFGCIRAGLNALDQCPPGRGWGGPPNWLGSPPGGTSLALAEIEAVVRSCLISKMGH